MLVYQRVKKKNSFTMLRMNILNTFHRGLHQRWMLRQSMMVKATTMRIITIHMHVHQQQKPGDWEPRQSALMKHDTEIKQNFTIATGYG
jgi:hypothetical protein